MFPDAGQRLHWGFPDPSAHTGTREERMEKVRSSTQEGVRVVAACPAHEPPRVEDRLDCASAVEISDPDNPRPLRDSTDDTDGCG